MIILNLRNSDHDAQDNWLTITESQEFGPMMHKTINAQDNCWISGVPTYDVQDNWCTQQLIIQSIAESWKFGSTMHKTINNTINCNLRVAEEDLLKGGDWT